MCVCACACACVCACACACECVSALMFLLFVTKTGVFEVHKMFVKTAGFVFHNNNNSFFKGSQ